MTEVFGEFLEDLSDLEHDDSLELTFSPSSRPIKQLWRNNRVSAHFVADYISTFFPVIDDDPKSKRRKKQTKGSVIYVANELLENAMKYHDREIFKCNIRFGIHFLEKPEIKVVLFVTNSLNIEQMSKLKDFIQKLSHTDPDELYILQLEKSAEDEDEEASGLGLLTMINDYDAKLGWKFDTVPRNQKAMIVTTMAQIPL
ncbi:MAG: DUF6272 family protein [Microcoleaceae cyanobacterium]